MKKFLSLVALLVATVANADTLSVTCPANSVTNLLGVGSSGYALISSISVTALTATNATVRFYDSSTGYATNVYPATTQISQKATNWIQCWTNYYQVRNCWTNLSLINVTNTVAATTNPAPVRATVAVAASGTTTIGPVAYTFEYGVWATNSSFGAVGITIDYER